MVFFKNLFWKVFQKLRKALSLSTFLVKSGLRSPISLKHDSFACAFVWILLHFSWQLFYRIDSFEFWNTVRLLSSSIKITEFDVFFAFSKGFALLIVPSCLFLFITCVHCFWCPKICSPKNNHQEKKPGKNPRRKNVNQENFPQKNCPPKKSSLSKLNFLNNIW